MVTDLRVAALEAVRARQVGAARPRGFLLLLTAAVVAVVPAPAGAAEPGKPGRYAAPYSEATSFNAYECGMVMWPYHLPVDPTVTCEASHGADAATGLMTLDHRMTRSAASITRPRAETGSRVSMTYAPTHDLKHMTVTAIVELPEAATASVTGAGRASVVVSLDVRHDGSPTEGGCCTSDWDSYELYDITAGSAAVGPQQMALTASLRGVPAGQEVRIVVILIGDSETASLGAGDVTNHASARLVGVTVVKGDGA